MTVSLGERLAAVAANSARLVKHDGIIEPTYPAARRLK